LPAAVLAAAKQEWPVVEHRPERNDQYEDHPMSKHFDITDTKQTTTLLLRQALLYAIAKIQDLPTGRQERYTLLNM
jgi:hypothetical protein